MPQRRTRSQGDLDDATAKTSASTASPSAPPAKKRKTNKLADIAPATTLTKVSVPTRSRRLQRMINPLRKVSESDTTLEFPAPRGLPKIYYGQNAPLPRWRTLLDVQSLGASVGRDLIRTHPGRTIIPGVDPNTDLKAHDSTVGLGDLKWSFDPGPASLWGKMTGQELYTYANGLLIEGLECRHSRRQLGEAIRNEQFAGVVAHVEDPIPPPPRLNLFGVVAPLSSTFNRIVASTKALKTQNQTFSSADRYERPELNYQPDQQVSNKKKDLPIASVMKKNMKGTLGPVDRQDPSFDPIAVPKTKATTKKGIAIRTKSTKTAAVDTTKKQQTQTGAGVRVIGSEEKLVGIPRSSQRNAVVRSKARKPTGDGDRVVRIGEYTLV
ncbi:hypothetical protein F1880_000359 [Penicillium rolfsii]|nr:hypothetical protein F1880_000359 [Penicillium rolfsii]